MDLLNKERLHQACPVDPRFGSCLKTVKAYYFWKHALAVGLVRMTLHFAVTKRRNQSLSRQLSFLVLSKSVFHKA
jgi:hypothetical protein